MAILLFISAAGASLSGNEDPLRELRWHHRVVIHVTPGEHRGELKELLARHQEDLVDRDMVFLDVSLDSSAPEEAVAPQHLALKPEQAQKLRRRFQVEADSMVFILLGKDGLEKARTGGMLPLEEWFAFIDSMPMRRQEMGRR